MFTAQSQFRFKLMFLPAGVMMLMFLLLVVSMTSCGSSGVQSGSLAAGQSGGSGASSGGAVQNQVPGTSDPCFRSAQLIAGPTNGAYYLTVAPFEHYDSSRTQLFPFACSLSDMGASTIQARASSVDFSTPYAAFTRNRDELFIYGFGLDAATQGGFVASVDPSTLAQRWRTQILATEIPNQWSYPGVGLAHANGFIYAIYANVLVKLDPATGAVITKLFLPEDPTQTGAAYNGIIVMPDGVLVVKGIERGQCVTPPGASASEEAFKASSARRKTSYRGPS